MISKFLPDKSVPGAVNRKSFQFGFGKLVEQNRQQCFEELTYVYFVYIMNGFNRILCSSFVTTAC